MAWFWKKKTETETTDAAPAASPAPVATPEPVPTITVEPATPTEEEKPATDSAPAAPAAEEKPALGPGGLPLPAKPGAVKIAVAAKQGATVPRENVKDLYYKLMNSLYDAVVVLDANGRVIDSNRRVESILGYTAADMWDKPISDIAPGLSPAIFNQIKEAIGSSHPVILDARCTRKDGTKFSAEICVCRIYLTRGENFTLTLRNIDKRLAALRQKFQKEMAAQGGVPATTKTVKLRAVKRPAPAAAPADKPAEKPTPATPPASETTPATPQA